jgi:membrane-bound lytic murein transglycosylase C
VFAIVHTESYFNPLAKSPANAYGLMQVVPTSGGRDAYRRVHGKDGVPTAEYLFTPNKNVELGTAYMVILASNYFKGVDDEKTREYLTICAYNTGAGNVAKAYNGTFNIRKAIPDINKKSAEENYSHLIKNLPYKETQDYLKKVSDRKKMYEGWYK